MNNYVRVSPHDNQPQAGPYLQHHNLASPLSGLIKEHLGVDRASTAYWALQPSRVVMIFLHGWGGSALTTWGGFPELASDHPGFAGVDMLFIGYPSRSSRAAYNVALIYRTLVLLMDNTQKFLQVTFGPARAPSFGYDRVILVGHSLGGALARGVAHAAIRENKPWAQDLRLALFAPAHTGADLLKLARMAAGVSSWSAPLLAGTLVKQQALMDLEPGSPFLQGLLSDAVALSPHPAARASLVVHAENDPVVSPDVFHQDPPATPYPGRTHVDCCKPKRQLFEFPILNVAEVRAAP